MVREAHHQNGAHIYAIRAAYTKNERTQSSRMMVVDACHQGYSVRMLNQRHS
jgi:hypothetical protein